MWNRDSVLHSCLLQRSYLWWGLDSDGVDIRQSLLFAAWTKATLQIELPMGEKEWQMETVTCANCGQVHMVSVSVAKTVWSGQKEVTYHYCGQNCQQDDYLKKLAVQLDG